MTQKELIDQLRQMSVETGSLVCLGCGYEHNCGINGCAILKEAADAITDLLSRTEAAEAALKKEKSYAPPLPPFDEDDPDVLYCQKCGSGEYLENEDGIRNNYCGQCGQRIDWADWDAINKEE